MDVSVDTCTEISSGGRIIRLVMHSKISEEDIRRIWVDRTATYGDIQNGLAAVDPLQNPVILQAVWGPRPYWIEATLESPVAASCQVLHAVFRNQSMRYLLCVVKTSDSDYPIAIFDPGLNSSMTISQVIARTHPNISRQAKLIASYSDGHDVQDVRLDYNALKRDHPSTFPTVITITIGEPPQDFLVYPFRNPIPMLLQIPLLHCKRLMQRAYDLKFFALQMIHLLSAVRHLLVSLADKVGPVFEDDSVDIESVLVSGNEQADLLRVAPLLTRELQTLLEGTDEIMNRLKSGQFDWEGVQLTIKERFDAICGEYPGAVAVRGSIGRFERLVRIDLEEAGILSPNGLDRVAHDPDTQMDDGRRGFTYEDEVEASSSARAHPPENSGGTQAIFNSDIERRIALLDEGARRIFRFHSSSGPDGPKLLLRALETYFNQNPATPVISIQRKLSHKRKKRGKETVICGICSKTGRFQNIAEHVVDVHFKLSLWYCGVNECRIALSRRSDLDLHRYGHTLARPRELKAEKLSQFFFPIDVPSPPATSLFSLGPGPTRNSRSRSSSSDSSTSRSYPTHSMFADGVSQEDVDYRPNDKVLSANIQPGSPQSHREHRGRLPASHPPTFDRHVHPTLALPPTVPPAIRVPSLPDERSRFLYATYSGSSSSGLGRGGTSSDAMGLSEQEAAYPLRPCGPSERVESSHAFDRYDSFNFLSPPSLTPTASSSGINLLPLPAPIHRVTTPRQSKSPRLGSYHSSNTTQGAQFSPSSNPHYSSISESSQRLMAPHSLTSSQQYYPHQAQINMQNPISGGPLSAGYQGSTFSNPPSRPGTPYSVDDDFDFNLDVPAILFSPRGPTQ